jgi:hypothetical protein
MRVGTLMRYMPQPVITGFTSGIAVIIFASQFKDLLGLQVEKVPAEFIAKIAMLAQHAGETNPWAIAIAGGSAAVILAVRRWAPSAPGFLVAVVLSAAAVALLDLPVDTIGSRFGGIPASLPMPALPHFSWQRIVELFPAALTIAFLAGVESLLSAVVADGMTGSRHRSNTELIAQGIANGASALFGGLPATGAIARTATNIRAGGLTPVAGMLHALLILAFVLGCPARELRADAGAGRHARGGGLEHERTPALPPHAVGAEGRSRGAAGDLPADGTGGSHRRHRSGHGDGGLRIHVPHGRRRRGQLGLKLVQEDEDEAFANGVDSGQRALLPRAWRCSRSPGRCSSAPRTGSTTCSTSSSIRRAFSSCACAWCRSSTPAACMPEGAGAALPAAGNHPDRLGPAAAAAARARADEPAPARRRAVFRR